MDSFIRKTLAARPSGFWPGFILGFLYYGHIFWWLWAAYPLTSVGVTNPVLGWLIILTMYLGSVVSMATAWGIGGWAINRIWQKKKNSSLFIFSTAATFTLAQYASAWFWDLIWIGPGGVLGPHWTFGNPAYWLVNLGPVRLTAQFIGIYGIDFLLALLLCCAYLCLKKYSPARLLAVLAIVALFSVGGLAGLSRSNIPAPKIPVALIGTRSLMLPDSANSLDLKDFIKKAQLLKTAAAQAGPDSLIVLPEGANFSTQLNKILDTTSLRQYFQGLAPDNFFAIDNLRITTDNRAKSKTVVISKDAGIVGQYDKRIATPWGEFMPYIVLGPIKIFAADLYKVFVSSQAFVHGTNSNILPLKIGKLKILVCSDVISPSFARVSGANLMIGQNSLRTFNGSRQLESQILAMARFRAVENAKDLAWASNFGRSFILDSQGHINAIAAQSGYEILTGTVVPNDKVTWYNKVGDWPILLISIGLLVVALL